MSAAEYLVKAVEYDKIGRKMEALRLYASGISHLLQQCKDESNAEKKVYLQKRIAEYMSRAEEIKDSVRDKQSRGQIVDKIHILANGSGYSYDTLFGKYLDSNVKEISLEEPYLRDFYQLINLVKFCEVAVSNCPNLKFMNVTTVEDPRSDQKAAFAALRKDLASRSITLDIEYSGQLHDRQIILSNGYIIKIGRGLNYFLPVDKFCLGYSNYDFRKCKETNVDIFFCPENKKV